MLAPIAARPFPQVAQPLFRDAPGATCAGRVLACLLAPVRPLCNMRASSLFQKVHALQAVKIPMGVAR